MQKRKIVLEKELLDEFLTLNFVIRTFKSFYMKEGNKSVKNIDFKFHYKKSEFRRIKRIFYDLKGKNKTMNINAASFHSQGKKPTTEKTLNLDSHIFYPSKL